MQMKTIKQRIVLEHNDIRMIDTIDYFNNHTYSIELYFKDDKKWHIIRTGNFYYCHELYKLLIRSW